MVSRLLLAGACALGLATAASAPALADTGPVAPAAPVLLFVPASVQVWSPEGLVRTIDCHRLDAHPACDPGEWPGNHDALVREHGGYRSLARSGRWFAMGGDEATVAAIDRADELGTRGGALIVRGLDDLDPYTPPRDAR